MPKVKSITRALDWDKIEESKLRLPEIRRHSLGPKKCSSSASCPFCKTAKQKAMLGEGIQTPSLFTMKWEGPHPGFSSPSLPLSTSPTWEQQQAFVLDPSWKQAKKKKKGWHQRSKIKV
jgi:hypothetical protein